MAEESKSVVQVKNDIAKIREWMTKQPHMPDIEEEILVRFLHACYYSLERTKFCLENFFSIRADTPELFSSRDPLRKELQTQFDITYFVCTQGDGKRYTFWQLNDPELKRYVFLDCVKCFFMESDVFLLEDKILNEDDVVVLDMKGIPPKILTMINLSVARTAVRYLLEAFPTRLKQVHHINCPPFMDKLFGLIKPLLPPEICKIIHFHQPNSETLYRYIPKEFVPVEFGGIGPKAEDLMKHWVEMIRRYRDFYLDDNKWISDDKKRPKERYAQETDLMKGSFRALCVD